MPFHWFGKVNFVPYTKVTDFADFLRDDKLKGTKCSDCGTFSFPPRADCPNCLSGNFEWVEISGDCTLHTWTRIHAAPTGFEGDAPYTIGVVDLKEGGRLLAWMGESIDPGEVEVGMDLKVVTRIFDDIEEIKVDYILEKP